MLSKPCIALGPEVCRPSWDWIGFDISRELSKYYDVKVFLPNATKAPKCDLAIFIKHRPSQNFLREASEANIKLIYCPVDHYNRFEEVQRDAEFLRHCQAILVHSERLVKVFEPYCQTVKFVEHHNRFGLNEPAVFRLDGYVMWVGGVQNLPPVIKWLKDHPLGVAIKFVTNYPTTFKGSLKNVLRIGDAHEIVNWSPRRQRDTMAGARAAFDIKGGGFNQMNKAPVKAQKFVASGIPFAVNQESYSAEYFGTRGYPVPSPMDTEYWLSRDYWDKTQAVRNNFREQLSLENVGLAYKQIIDRILEAK